MGPRIIVTERVNMRAWTAEDVPRVMELFSDPEVVRYINDGKPITLKQAERFVTRYARIQRERGWSRWALELKDEPGVLAGFCGVGCTFAPETELGWTLRRDLWGQGIATEAAQAALDYCFGMVRFERIISAIDPGNERSIAVAERLGMERDGTLELDGETVLRYAIESPHPAAEPGPGFIAHCRGEPRGSSLAGTPEL